MEEVQKDNPDVVFEVVDVENDNRGLAAENGIMGVPAIVMLVDGLPMTRFAGVRPKEYIQEEIDRLK
jgi:thioredoxin-like negative regulator of GroEL